MRKPKPATAPSVEDLAKVIDLRDREFVHRLPGTAATDGARCGGFRLVTEAEFHAHPCPDCARKERRG